MSKQPAIQQIKTFPYLLALYSFPLLILLFVAIVREPMDFSMEMFTRDPSAVAEMHPFVGLVSNLGIIFWTSSTVICLFCGLIIRCFSDQKKLSSFLIFSGFITLLLMLDDFFQLHEVIYKCYFGIDEIFVFIAYIVLMLSDLLIFKRIILKTDYLILFSSVFFFGSSLIIDHFQHQINSLLGSEIRILLEDGSKLFGIVGWFGYFARCVFVAFRETINPPKNNIIEPE